jgi:hypothetical protein
MMIVPCPTRLARLRPLCLLFALALPAFSEGKWLRLDSPAHFRPLADRSWTFANGVFTTVRDPRLLEDLITLETFDNFELTLEWRLEPGGNSGVKHHITEEIFLLHEKPGYLDGRRIQRAELPPGARGELYLRGLEFQLLDDERHPDGARGRNRHTGALYNKIPPTASPAHAPGEWNTLRLRYRGGLLEHWVNGKPVLSAKVSGPASPVALQNHADSIAQFRKIRIRRLD